MAFRVYRVRRRETLIKICLAVLAFMPVFRWLLTMTLSAPLLQMELFYRSLPTRLDALLIGGLIALSLRGPGQEAVRRIRLPLLVVSSLLFVFLYLVSVKSLGLPYSGSASNWVGILGFTLINLFAAALILECIHPGSFLGRVLSLKPLRALGIISYGFYVYHDLFHDFYAYFAQRFFPQHAYSATLITAFTATLLIATMSYRILEKPLLRLKNRFASQIHLAPEA